MTSRTLSLGLPLLLLTTSIALALGGRAQAQVCGIFSKVDFTAYGSGCPGAGSLPPILAGSFDPRTCSIDLKLDRYQWLPNVYLKQWTLVLGTQKASLPILRPACTLLVQPLVIVGLPNTQTTLNVPLPNDRGLLGLPIHCQAGATYFGFYFDTDLTNGLTVVAN
jgi:hypothetical protein